MSQKLTFFEASSISQTQLSQSKKRKLQPKILRSKSKSKNEIVEKKEKPRSRTSDTEKIA